MPPETPIVVVCEGSPIEMGRAQGSALQDKIQAASSALGELEAFRRHKPWWMPYSVYRAMAQQKSWRILAARLSDRHPDLSQRLMGIAEGSRRGLKEIYLFNAMEPLLSALRGSTACPGACSAVAVRGRRSASGEMIIARNFDYLPVVQPLYTIRKSCPQAGLSALEFTTAPLVGAVDGMNQEGLCIAYNYAFVTDSPRASAIPNSMLICEALQHCATVQAAAEWISNRPRWGGGLLMLADAFGDLASLELSNTRSHLRRPAADEDHLFHTNNFTDPGMKEVQIPDDAIYTDSAPRPLRGRREALFNVDYPGLFKKNAT